MLIKQIVEEFKERLKVLYRERFIELIIYGSCARGDATDNSDIDLLVVLRGEVLPGQEIDRMIDEITEINLKYGVLLSVHPVSEKDYETLNSPLLINVRREGVRV